jgi:hypothetical protein
MNITPNLLVPLLLLGSLFPLHIYFNVILCQMLGLLLIFFNALCRVMFSFLFVTNTIFVVTLSTTSMRFYTRGKLYLFSNLVIYNPFAFFPMTWDNLLCFIVSHQFILLIIFFVLLYFMLNSLALVPHLFLNLIS